MHLNVCLRCILNNRSFGRRGKEEKSSSRALVSRSQSSSNGAALTKDQVDKLIDATALKAVMSSKEELLKEDDDL